jgi:hypothetical protein
MTFTAEVPISHSSNGGGKPELTRLEKVIFRGASFNAHVRDAVFTYDIAKGSKDPYIEMFIDCGDVARSKLLEQVLGARAGRKITPDGLLLEYEHPEFDFLLQPLEPHKNTRNMEDRYWVDSVYLGAMLTRDFEHNRIHFPTPIARPLLEAFETLHGYTVGRLKTDARRPHSPVTVENVLRIETDLLHSLESKNIPILQPLYKLRANQPLEESTEI